MLEEVKTKEKQLKDYQEIIDPSLYQEITDLAKNLKGLKVLHLNATSFGGGVAEILNNLIPLINDIGLKAEWQVIAGDNQFFNLTKKIHDAFQNGEIFNLTNKEQEIYEKTNRENANNFEGNYDLIFVHDPQPMALPYFLKKTKAKFVWRSHIDTSRCQINNWSYFEPFLNTFSAAVFTAKEYCPKNLPIERTYFIPPAIDPFSAKNMDLDSSVVSSTLLGLGLDLDRPIITQVSRFDPWKDPIGVIKAYRLAKEKTPGLQLVLAASLASDDPEGGRIFEEAKKFNGFDKDVKLIINKPDRNDLVVNSLQRGSDILIQKSIREGFGLTVTEGMWKEKPVIGGDTVGIRLQINDGSNGYLVETVEECADKINYLLLNKDEADAIGKKAQETVRDKFLMPRLLRDHLSVYNEVVNR
jgi:trehalose synthase